MIVIKNENNEMILTRTVTKWQICMDYYKLNAVMKKDHFPLPFVDQRLDRLAGRKFYYFLDGYYGYNQITIAPEDLHKTTLHVLMEHLHFVACLSRLMQCINDILEVHAGYLLRLP